MFQQILAQQIERGFYAYDSDAFRQANQGTSYLIKGDYSQALVMLQKALEMRQKLIPPDDKRGDHLNRIAIIKNSIGMAYLGLDQFELAEICFNEAIDFRKQHFGNRDWAIIGVCVNLANLYIRKQDFTRAQKVLRQMDEYFREADYQTVLYPCVRSSQDLQRADALEIDKMFNTLGIEMKRRGDLDQAIAIYQEGLSFNESLPQTFGFSRHPYYINLGMAYKAQKNYLLAIEFLMKAVSTIEANIEEPTIQQQVIGYYLPALKELAELCHAEGRQEEARQYIDKALIQGERYLGGDHAYLDKLKAIAIDIKGPQDPEPLSVPKAKLPF